MLNIGQNKKRVKNKKEIFLNRCFYFQFMFKFIVYIWCHILYKRYFVR